MGSYKFDQVLKEDRIAQVWSIGVSGRSETHLTLDQICNVLRAAIAVMRRNVKMSAPKS